MTRCLGSLLAVLTATAVAACSVPSPRAGGDSTIVDPAPAVAQAPDSLAVLVRGPTLVAFLPRVTQAQVDSSEELSTVLDDFTYHLSDAADSLRALGFSIEDRHTGPIEIVDGRHRRRFVPARDSADVGYLFLAPGRPGRVHYGVMTSTELIEAAHDVLGTTKR